MLIRDVLRLGVSGIRTKKWRHILVVMSIVLPLILVIVMGSLICGVERNVRQVEPKDGQVVGRVASLSLSNVDDYSLLDMLLGKVDVKTPFTGYEVSADKTFNEIWLTYFVQAGVLLAIGMLVAVMAIIRLIGQENKNRNLYISVGASPADVRKIYGCYTFILSVITCFVAVLIGLLIVFLLSLAHAKGLSEIFNLAYAVDMKVNLVGWGWQVTLLLGIFLLVTTIVGVIASNPKRNN